MKRKTILLCILALMAFSTNLFAQKDRTLTKGFSINLVTGFPAANYGAPNDAHINEEFQLNSIWGLQLGNRWYFSPKEKYGFGLMINWIDMTAGVKTGTKGNYDWGVSIADVSFFEVGPVGSYVLTKDIVLDAYYNLRPTGFASVESFSANSSSNYDITYTYAGFGFTHAIGAAFRYKALNIGLEYVMGNIDCEGTYSGPDGDEDLDSQKNIANNFRVMVGVKF